MFHVYFIHKEVYRGRCFFPPVNGRVKIITGEKFYRWCFAGVRFLFGMGSIFFLLAVSADGLIHFGQKTLLSDLSTKSSNVKDFVCSAAISISY